MQLNISQSDWFLAVFSAFVGLLLPYLVGAIRYAVLRSKKSHIEGEWIGHHYSFENGISVFRKTFWKIKKGVNVAYAVRMDLYPEPHLRYSGSLFFEEGHIVGQLKSKIQDHAETVAFRAYLPVPPNNQICIGVYLSYDYNKNIIALPVILSKSELEEQEYIELLKANYKIHSSQRILHVRKI